ncbi:MAG: hypothetical protein WCX61_02440 [Candidatus Peribacteraceae bacterium]
MWPFCRKPKPTGIKKSMERLIAGFVIGGAIGSILGRKLLDMNDEEEDLDEAQESEDDEI